MIIKTDNKEYKTQGGCGCCTVLLTIVCIVFLYKVTTNGITITFSRLDKVTCTKKPHIKMTLGIKKND